MDFSYNPEKIGRRRLPDNKQFRTQLNSESSFILSALMDLLPSNYPKTGNSNLGVLYRVFAREFARLQSSINLISDDKVFTETRPEYLHQILGERLFLDDRLSPISSNDVAYREFLIAIKDAYLAGSKKSVIEDSINKFTKLDIQIKELYQEARKPNSAASLIDTHKMLIEVFLDEVGTNRDIASIINDLPFFVDLIKPAHVLYDTSYIWKETIVGNKVYDILFGDLGGGCAPKYIYTPFSVHQKTFLAQKIRVVNDPSDPSTFEIGSIHETELILFLTNDTRVIVEPGSNGTLIYGTSGHRIPFSELLIGQRIQMTYQVIPGDFEFYYTSPEFVGVPNYTLFYKNLYRKPAFQEFVKKEMDANGRFPLQIATDPTTICDRWVQDVLQPMYEDLRKNCSDKSEAEKNYTITLAPHMWFPRLPVDNTPDGTSWRAVLGDLYSYTMPFSPLTDGTSSPAAITDVTVYKDTTALSGAMQSVDASSSLVRLNISPEYWDSTLVGGAPAIGSEIKFDYKYLADGTNYSNESTFVFGINYWQLPDAPIADGSGSNSLAQPADVSVMVDGTYIPDAVLNLYAVTGYVELESLKDFWVASPLGRIPGIGDSISFDYYQSGRKIYSMLFDDPSRTMDDDVVFDGPVDSGEAIPLDEPSRIEYKFRADLLYHASVLNSPDTLRLNNYLKPANRASLAHKKDSLNHFNYFFSPEYLTDTDTGIVLNDKYLLKDIPAAITLNEGTPPFQKTYSYQPGLVNQKKLQDIRKNNELLMYSDLLLKETKTGSNTVNLSSLCDTDFGFKVQFKETLNPLEECEDWVIFDTAVTKDLDVIIPGDSTAVQDLRIADINLRDNLILRETESSGTVTISHSFNTGNTDQTSFTLPETIKKTYEDYVVDFPALPVMHDADTTATSSDLIVSIDGVVTPVVFNSFNPITGEIDIQSLGDELKEEYIEITQEILDRRFINLSAYPQNEQVAVNIVSGAAQVSPADFSIVGAVLFIESPMWNSLSIGDEIVVSYMNAILSGTTVTFTYKIVNTATITVVDIENSRVFDSDDVLASYCYNGYQQEIGFNYTEYINFLDDYSKGIKFKYLNKDTNQIEDLIFSGPVFETYNPAEDEISGVESFPDALVRIANPLSNTDPLDLMMNFDFLNNKAVRIRRKTIKELLPDRTFRSMEILEALPV